MFKRKIFYVSVVVAVFLSSTSGLFAAAMYGRVGLDCGYANSSTGAMVDIAIGGMADSGIGGGIDLVFSDKMGYEYDPTITTGDPRHLNFISFCPEIRYVLLPNWPVNIALSVTGGPGWIGVEDENNPDNSRLEDAILLVKGRACLNLLLWNGVGFYVGGNYTKVYRSQSVIFTNKELSGFEFALGFTGHLSGTAQ